MTMTRDARRRSVGAGAYVRTGCPETAAKLNRKSSRDRSVSTNLGVILFGSGKGAHIRFTP